MFNAAGFFAWPYCCCGTSVVSLTQFYVLIAAEHWARLTTEFKRAFISSQKISCRIFVHWLQLHKIK
jgi:hypothetical protein